MQSEHPAAAPHDGEHITSLVVAALAASPLWSKTALFVTYDENGGFFDHVAPPTPHPGTPDEFVTGHHEPIGLGFRVPMLAASHRGRPHLGLQLPRPDASIPLLPVAPPNDPAQHPECLNAEVQSNPYVAPDPSATPPAHQEPGRRPSPSGPVHARGGHAD